MARPDVCPKCGNGYEYRLPQQDAYRFRVTNEYRCDPRQHGYVYFHAISTDQAINIAYNDNRERLR